eukprot:UN02978
MRTKDHIYEGKFKVINAEPLVVELTTMCHNHIPKIISNKFRWVLQPASHKQNDQIWLPSPCVRKNET